MLPLPYRLRPDHHRYLPPAAPRAQAGVSLIIVLIMLVIIGWTSAAAMRNATSGEKLTNNIRLQNLAHQYAEAALRYCEAEMIKADADRVATLAEANISTTPVGAADAATGWGQAASWTGAGGIAATKTTLPEAWVRSQDSSFRPSRLPECVVERQGLADGSLAYVITARGFSPGYTADGVSGVTTAGSVVWLQSLVLLD
jgi:type IV pilus assembly protein PilX